MATLHDIHNSTGVSIRTLNKLDKLGFLRVTKSDSPEAGKMLTNLRKGNPLTAGQLAMLYQEPALFSHLGAQEFNARDALDAMGDVEGERAPIEISGMLAFAAAKDRDSIAAVAAWVRSYLDARPGLAYGYTWIAVRLLASLPPHLLKANLALTSAAIIQVRKHPLLDGFSALDVDGKTIFGNPKKPLDL